MTKTLEAAVDLAGDLAIGVKAAIQHVPLLAHMGAWGRRHTHPSEELSIRAEILEAGGPDLWAAFMEELRAIHLNAPAPARSVFAELQSAYLAKVAEVAAR